MDESEGSKSSPETKRIQDAVDAKGVFRIVSSEGEESPIDKNVIPGGDDAFGSVADRRSFDEAAANSPYEDEDCDDAFFAKSFALTSDRRESERAACAFADGLRSLFDEDEDDVDDNDSAESDSVRFQREMESERRESLDGVLRQGDADFLAEAGRKFDSSQNGDVGYAPPSSLDSLFEQSLNEATQEAKIRPESILEAMLFVGNRDNSSLTLKSACELMRDVSESEAQAALFALNERYNRDGCPYRIVRDGEGYRMALRQEYSDFASRFSGKTREFKLSQTAVDVLSLIAYRQPIALDEILEVRNNAGSALAQLVKRELITQEKQVLDKKKVTFYKTTDRFLKLFNLESLDDLPIVGDIDYR